MPKSHLLTTLRRVARSVASEDRLSRGATTSSAPYRRRDVLGALAATGAVLVAGSPPAMGRTGGARIAVVGAGLAGLTAAYDLRRAGVIATVYEASTRLGGRCYTIRDVFADGQIAEHGGEFIDTDHEAIRRLAHLLGLTLDSVLDAEPKGTEALYYFNGAPYSVADANRDFAHVYPIVQRQSKALGDFSYRHANALARKLDAISVAQWVDQYVPGGGASRLGQLINTAISEENAADATDLSGIVVPGLFAPDPANGFNLYYTGSDQRFRVRGGNDQIATRLAAALPGQIETSTVLTAVKRQPDGRIRLSLARDNHVSDETFDRVVLALPFAVMRGHVNITQAGFRPLKQRAIAALGMGASVKFQLQFMSRVWNRAGCTGEIRLSSQWFQTTWDATRAQAGAAGVLNFWSGGKQAANAGSADTGRLAHDCLAEAERLIPGLGGAWNGRMTRDVWARNPWSLGSYSYQPIGYATTIAGIEREREGNCFFAGEHTSDNAGYLNAAVTTGQRAAHEVLASLAR